MKKYIIGKILFLGLLAIFCSANTIMAQQNGISISSTIVDESGNPIEGVKILAPKNLKATTDLNGKFTLNIGNDKAIVLKKEGYDTQLINTSDLSSQITIKKSTFLASETDLIKLGFDTTSKREMTGATSSINPQERMVYDNTQFVRDYIQGLMTGVRGTSNIRGIGNAVFVIDGVIGRDPNILNMDEVDQITVLKDASAVALYGNQARNGVIVINTKRGAINNKTATVNIRNGLRTPIALPNYLGSAEYMELFNEARTNDGLDTFYDSGLIENTRSGANPFLYPDVDFYSDKGYLRGAVSNTDIITQFSGGNENTQYYVNMGWMFDQSLVKINPDANRGSNRFNIRANIDFKVNDWIKSSIDVVTVVNSSRSARSNLLSEGTTFKPNAYAPLLPISLIDTTDPVLAGQVEAANTFDGNLLGGSQAFSNNTPIANILAGGYTNSVFRSTQFNNSIDFDLSSITEGLTAKTYLSFDFFHQYNVTINNQFRVYEPTWNDDKIIGLSPFGDVDLQDLTENISTRDFASRLGFYGVLNYEKSLSKNHTIGVALLGFLNSFQQEGVIQTDRNTHTALQLSYDYKKKIFLDLSGTYINSIKLPEGNKGGFSPTVGLGYIMSEESFMKDVSFLNYLKFKASAGIIKTDIRFGDAAATGGNEFFLFNKNYSDGANFTWGNGLQNREQDISQGANPNLTFEDRIDFNIGLESYLFNSVFLEFNYFKSNFDNQLTRLENKYSSFYNIFRPYENFNEDSYSGFELGLNYNANITEDFSINFGGNILYANSEVTKRDEIVEFDYQNRVGRPRDALFGLVDDGFYSVSDFTSSSNGVLTLNDDLPIPAFGAVQPGDIKYIDQNNDGIVDNNDQTQIGRFSNPWSYGLNLRLKYKNLSLFILGIGESGGNQVRDDNYFWVDGNDKYSEVVLGRWTPETANSATFPRLSSSTNNNNFRRSTFWMYDNSYFQIERAQITYEFDKNVCEKLGMNHLSVNLAGSNLVQFSKNKDIRQLNIGSNPQFRNITLGLRTSF